MTEPISNPKLHTAEGDYHSKLLSSIEEAENRILLETMVLDQAGEMDVIMDACLHARKRGVGVLMVYDIYSHLGIIGKQGLGNYQAFQSRLTELETEGAIVHRVGARQINPFAGRHHAKAAIIDDHAYIGGGINLTGDSFETRDFMLRYDDELLAQTLYDTLPQAALDRSSDQILFADETTEVLLDAGNKNESIIYDRTCELAERAANIYYVSKLVPDGKLLDILKTKDVQYWYNTVQSATNFDKLAIYIDQAKVEIDNNYSNEAVLHAKFCVAQLPDGTYEAITGSHNFNSRGVAFGTQELAIHTKDQELCQRLIAFAESL
jgi:phosphatidylserine/phosphatidylglycerophosphate/cardiolipin synthase-like enzyme